MDLNEISQEIRSILNERRNEIELVFYEEEHKYFMKDLDGVVRSNFPSVSTLYSKFYEKFDSERISLYKANGDLNLQQEILSEWRKSGEYAANMGSRVHYELEKKLISLYGNYKDVRQPIYEIDEKQKIVSDNMIIAGNNFINLMLERGAILLDTEIVLGCPHDGYVGQPDKVWLMMNKNKDDFGFVITDWKTNKPKNFEINSYTNRLYEPFQDYPNNSLGHYYLQLPFYGRLLLNMLKNSKFANKKILGGVVVLLKDDKTFTEYKIPKYIIDTILNLNLEKYIKR